MTIITLATWQNLLSLGPVHFEEKDFATGAHNKFYGTRRPDLIPPYELRVLRDNHPMIRQELLFFDLEGKRLRTINFSRSNDFMLAASLTKTDRKSILENIKTKPMKRQQPTLNFLATILMIGEVRFSYQTKKGKQKLVKGTLDTFAIPNAKFSDGGIDGNGNLTYWDIVEKDWRTVQKSSPIEIDLGALDETVFTDKAKYLANNISTFIPSAGTVVMKSPSPSTVTTAPVTRTLTTPDPIAFNNNSVSPDILLNLLNQKIVKFEYTSQKGLRVAYGTTDSTRSPKVGNIDNKSRTGSILYYDIEKDGIRTVTFQNKDLFKVIEVLDLPLKQ